MVNNISQLATAPKWITGQCDDLVTDTITSLISSGTLPSFAGSTVAGYAMGFVLKKVIKWILIAAAFLAGIFFIALQLMQKNGYISSVNWTKLGNDTSIEIQHWVANVDLPWSFQYSRNSCNVRFRDRTFSWVCEN